MIVACVRTGEKYPVHYVHRLKMMVTKHLTRPHRFICFTDRPEDLKGSGVTALSINEFKLKSWWGKMALFAHEWRQAHRVLYFDLDTVIVGSLNPLADLEIDFGICANFTRASGNLDWPCRYGSCVMTIGPAYDGEMFKRFWSDRWEIMARAGQFGDQKAIEELEPNATMLQACLPSGFFLGYRDLDERQSSPPQNCSIVVFAGRKKPHNCEIPWVRQAWK